MKFVLPMARRLKLLHESVILLDTVAKGRVVVNASQSVRTHTHTHTHTHAHTSVEVVVALRLASLGLV